MNTRRYITLALALCLVLSLFAGCGSTQENENSEKSSTEKSEIPVIYTEKIKEIDGLLMAKK